MDNPGTRDPGSDERMLSSWKEIAEHFGRDVRTVQRWEKDQGLPVHRHRHTTGVSVYAFPEELQAWWRGERGLDAPAPAHGRLYYAGVAVVVLAAAAIATAIVTRGRGRGGSATDPPLLAHDVSFAYQSSAESPIVDAVAGDFDGDRIDDLAIATLDGEVRLLLDLDAKTTGGSLADVPGVRLTGLRGGGTPRLGAAGDFDGDGIADLLVGDTLSERAGYFATSDVLLVPGRRAWPAEAGIHDVATVRFTLAEQPDAKLMPCRLEGGADLDGDGLDDVLLSAMEGRAGDLYSAGAVFVHRGRHEWPERLDAREEADVRLDGSLRGQGLGAICGVDDLDGDGRSDLWTTASEDRLWNLLGGRGAVHVVYGREAWERRLDSVRDANRIVRGSRPGVLLGPVATADVDGDGRRDLVVARPYLEIDNHLYRGATSQPEPGTVRVWLGRESKQVEVTDADADIVIRGTSPGDRLGSGLLAHDFDGDGRDDLVLSRASHELWLLYGRDRWVADGDLADHDAHLLSSSDDLGTSHKLQAADLDGDGLAGIVRVSPLAGFAAEASGRVLVVLPYNHIPLEFRPRVQPNVVVPNGVSALWILGVPGLQLDQASLRIEGTEPLERIPWDYNGDGLDDLQLLVENRRLPLAPGPGRILITGRSTSGALVAAIDNVEVLSPTAVATPARGVAPTARR